MKPINLRLVLVVLFSIAMNAANAQVKKKRSLPKKQKVEMTANFVSPFENRVKVIPKTYSMKIPVPTREIITLNLDRIGCRCTQYIPKPYKDPDYKIRSCYIYPNMPEGMLDKQIEMALGNARGSRPENVVYYIDWIQVRHNNISSFKEEENIFRK
jgi:hypothetical protein